MVTPDTDLYPSITFKDPLLYPLYIKTNDHVSIDVQCRDDTFLSVFCEKLNAEIIDDIEEFKEHKDLLNQIFWNGRVHGWCVVQPYNDDTYKCYSSLEWTEWITEINEVTEKKERVGLRISWTDDLGNNWDEDLYFEDRTFDDPKKEPQGKCYLFVWKNGNGRSLPNQPALSAFALPDVSLGVMSLAIQCRQILSTMSYGAVNPFFYHLVYGNSIQPADRTKLASQMQYINVSAALGANEDVLKEIRAIENSSVEKSIAAITEMLGYFASVTRLPLSYYLGEKQTGGLGDTGESTDELKIMKKKEFVLQHFIPILEELFSEQFLTPLPDLYNYYSDKAEEEAKAKEDLMLQSQSLQGNKNQEGVKQ